MGKRGIIFGSIFAFILMLLIPSISAIEFKTVTENMTDYEEQPTDLIPTITVSGGLGITIEIEDVNEGKSVIIVTDGAKIRFQRRNDFRNKIRIYVAITDLGDFPALFDHFVLHISIGNDKYSYECKSFLFVFTFGFTPLDA